MGSSFFVFRGIDDIFGSDADAVFHIEDSAVDRDPVKQRCSQMYIIEEVPPFFEPQLSGEDRGVFSVSCLYQLEEQPCLFLFYYTIPDLVNEQNII